jgi:hypothetical protein
MKEYSLRDGCEAPTQPRIKNEDLKHPRFQEYMRYRCAMNAQLVSCPSFQNWLSQQEFAAWDL